MKRCHQGSIPSENDIGFLLNCKEDELQPLFLLAREVQHSVYGRDVYIRGLIEFTNYCKNDCYYCGIRRGNRHAERYRLTKEDILDCCEEGYRLGFRTFVLQGGEDPFWTDALLTGLISAIKNRFPDCAVTLSVGEKSRESYRAYYAAGADRFLLRHETANGAPLPAATSAGALRRTAKAMPVYPKGNWLSGGLRDDGRFAGTNRPPIFGRIFFL